jgi:hypothetical protein
VRITITEARNRCYRGNAISFTYSESVFVALGIHLAMRMRLIVISGLSDSKNFPHSIVNGTIEHKMCVLSLKLNIFVLRRI